VSNLIDILNKWKKALGAAGAQTSAGQKRIKKPPAKKPGAPTYPAGWSEARKLAFAKARDAKARAAAEAAKAATVARERGPLGQIPEKTYETLYGEPVPRRRKRIKKAR